MNTTAIKIWMTPSHPGEFVRLEIIEALNLTISAAAEILGVRRATLSALLNGKAALSPEMALRLEKAFDIHMDLLMRMQAWHDVARMRRLADKIATDVRRYESRTGVSGNGGRIR